MRFAICNEMFEGWKPEDVFAYVSEVGYDAVEIAPFTLAERVTDISKTERQRLRRSAQEKGLEIAGLHWLLVSPKGLHINHPDEEIRNRTRDYFLALIRFCADLGGKIMVVGSPKQRNILKGETREVVWERTKEFFHQVLPTAEEEGVTLCIEALPPVDTNFINTMSECVQLVQEINHPNFQTMADVKSMCSEKRPLDEVIREGGSHIRHVHANDENLRGPGFGDTDFRPVFKALRGIGYSGYMSVEVFDFSPDPQTIASKSLEYLRKVSEEECIYKCII